MATLQEDLHAAQYRYAQHYLMRLKTYGELYHVKGHIQLAVRQFEDDWYQIEHSLAWAASLDSAHGAELCLAFCEAGGLLFTDLQDFPRRLAWYTAALAAAQRLGQTRMVVLQLTRLGILYRDLNKYEEAQTYVQQALTLAHELDAPDLVANCYHELGVIAKRLGQQSEAWGLLQQALEIVRTLRNDALTAGFLQTLSTVAYEMGDINTAIDLARESFAIVEVIGSPREIARLAYTIGSILLSDDTQLEDARRFLWRSYEMYCQVGNKRMAASAACNIAADLIVNVRDYEKAIRLAEDALTTYRSLNYPLGICNALTVLGDAALKQGNLQRARARYGEGLAVAEETNSAWDIISLSLGLGKVANQAAQFTEAQQHLSIALRVAVEGGMLGLARLALVQLALPLAYQSGQPGHAVELITFAIDTACGDSLVQREAEPIIAQLQQELSLVDFTQALERGKQLEFDGVIREFINTAE